MCIQVGGLTTTMYSRMSDDPFCTLPERMCNLRKTHDCVDLVIGGYVMQIQFTPNAVRASCKLVSLPNFSGNEIISL